MTPVFIMLLAMALPLLAAPLISLCGRSPNLRESIALLAGIATFLLSLSITPHVMAGQAPAFTLAEPIVGLPIYFSIEPLGMMFALLASFLWPVTTLYSIGYMRGHHEKNQTRFYTFFAIAMAAVMGLAFSGNMFTLFIFYEVITLSTYPLVTHAGSEQARKAGRVYLGLLVGTSIGLLLLALIWTWELTGTTSFTPNGILQGKASTTLLAILLALYIFGIGKAAIMPFHRWLPAAMVAPTPVSALLHAVAVVKAGVFTVLKVIIYIFGIDLTASLFMSDWLLYLAGATVLLASLVAMRKDNLKARLAYSTISQLGYVTVGALLASTAGIIGGSMHMVMHAFGKITLFFCAGAILVAAHKTEISQMRGLGRVMPFTMAAFLIGAISIIGLPPAGGTWSKWYLAIGTLEAGHMALLVVLMLSSLLNIAYLLPIPIRAFFSSDPHNRNPNSGLREAPLASLIAIAVTATGCVALFIYPDPVYTLASMIPLR